MVRKSIPAERMLLLEQELSRDGAKDVMASLRSLDPRERGKVLALVATLGVDPDKLLASDLPSPGEARKAALAFGLGRQVWMVGLDETSNHLDLPSVERLESALASYPGALVVVTHDESFARALDLRPFDLDE